MGELVLPIVGDLVVLRALSLEDLVDHTRLFSDPNVLRYLYEEQMDEAAMHTHLEGRLPARLPEEGQWLNLAATLPDGTYIGEVGLGLTSAQHRQGEIGYVFDPAYGGQGLATEAARLMVSLGFSSLGAHRITGRLDARNERSARLLERIGMRREALLKQNEFVKGEWTDELVYAVLAQEWL